MRSVLVAVAIGMMAISCLAAQTGDDFHDGSVVAACDRALGAFRDTRGLIVDLRNTPSGGNSSVARGIPGRFVGAEQAYQKHVLPSEERDTGVRRSWFELVSPRGQFVYSQPVAVLVDRWTGSMGEGLAIGFDVNGAPREAFQPTVPVDVARADTNEDPFIAAALRVMANR